MLAEGLVCVGEYLVLVKLELYCRIVSSRETASSWHVIYFLLYHYTDGEDLSKFISSLYNNAYSLA